MPILPDLTPRSWLSLCPVLCHWGGEALCSVLPPFTFSWLLLQLLPVVFVSNEAGRAQARIQLGPRSWGCTGSCLFCTQEWAFYAETSCASPERRPCWLGRSQCSAGPEGPPAPPVCAGCLSHWALALLAAPQASPLLLPGTPPPLPHSFCPQPQLPPPGREGASPVAALPQQHLGPRLLGPWFLHSVRFNLEVTSPPLLPWPAWSLPCPALHWYTQAPVFTRRALAGTLLTQSAGEIRSPLTQKDPSPPPQPATPRWHWS